MKSVTTFTKNLCLGTLLVASSLIASANHASAEPIAPPQHDLSIKATLTADNHYALFSGNSDGSILNFFGRNEKGAYGGGAGWNVGTQGGQSFTGGNGWNWSNAETWDFGAKKDDYLYVVTWDDAAVDESWIGDFDITSGGQTKRLSSNPGSWEYTMSKFSTNPGDWGDTPLNGVLNKEIVNATWNDSISRGLNGQTGPWGAIAGVSDKAEFLNTTTNSSGLKRDNDRYTIFRTKNTIAQTVGIPPTQAVPEPTAILGLAAVGVTGTLLRRKRG